MVFPAFSFPTMGKAFAVAPDKPEESTDAKDIEVKDEAAVQTKSRLAFPSFNLLLMGKTPAAVAPEESNDAQGSEVKDEADVQAKANMIFPTFNLPTIGEAGSVASNKPEQSNDAHDVEEGGQANDETAVQANDEETDQSTDDEVVPEKDEKVVQEQDAQVSQAPAYSAMNEFGSSFRQYFSFGWAASTNSSNEENLVVVESQKEDSPEDEKKDCSDFSAVTEIRRNTSQPVKVQYDTIEEDEHIEVEISDEQPSSEEPKATDDEISFVTKAANHAKKGMNSILAKQRKEEKRRSRKQRKEELKKYLKKSLKAYMKAEAPPDQEQQKKLEQKLGEMVKDVVLVETEKELKKSEKDAKKKKKDAKKKRKERKQKEGKLDKTVDEDTKKSRKREKKEKKEKAAKQVVEKKGTSIEETKLKMIEKESREETVNKSVGEEEETAQRKEENAQLEGDYAPESSTNEQVFGEVQNGKTSSKTGEESNSEPPIMSDELQTEEKWPCTGQMSSYEASTKEGQVPVSETQQEMESLKKDQLVQILSVESSSKEDLGPTSETQQERESLKKDQIDANACRQHVNPAVSAIHDVLGTHRKQIEESHSKVQPCPKTSSMFRLESYIQAEFVASKSSTRASIRGKVRSL